MPVLSARSCSRLSTCHQDLQTVCRELIKQYDFCVLEGYRNEADQQKAVREGKSHASFGHSKHNKWPSWAVDIAPYPVDWQDESRFREMIIRFDAVACLLRQQGRISSQFVYGGYWKSLVDWPHIEIKEE